MRVEGSLVLSPHRSWAHFRHSVIGGLLSSPPAKGELNGRIQELVEKKWKHPITSLDHRVEFSTIESWYYRALKSPRDQVGILQSKVRSDAGSSRRVSEAIATYLATQYAERPYWDGQLHFDNLKTEVGANSSWGSCPSYSTVLRYMKAKGYFRTKRLRNADRQTAADTATSQSLRETRSWEVEFVNALWHFDGHGASIKVLTEDGFWETPVAIGFFDDCSRLCAHLQWYWGETAENVAHCLTQAIQKRGLPGGVYSDNGRAEVAHEIRAGLDSLGAGDKHTRNYSPQMNGKCEHVWSRLEGRLISMLTGQKGLTLKQLNDLTQAWVEMEYNRTEHRETKERPIDRFMKVKDVSRPAPSSETLRHVFCIEVCRRQRRSDGTISLEGRRYEIPSRFRTQENLHVKYARWDLGFVHIVDPRTGKPLARIYPIDKQANADGRRRVIENPVIVSPVVETTTLPPLLQKLKNDYQASGLPPAYLTKDEISTKENNDDDK